ncbi:ABC transporter permease [Paenibacillus sp. GCM10027626]|uniref:ABC transporter permease n=1 Tax=Paenibacillus sp. GCM10027626 TaxID=3273411 RepID=UPI00363D084C
MNILAIALKELKSDFRDRRTVLFLMAFPIVLMLILGLALTNAFSDNLSLGEIKVLMKDTSSGQLSQAFSAFAAEMGKSGVKFEALQPGTDGREEVEQNRYVDYVEIKDSGISLYGSSRNVIESNIVQGMLASFTDKYNAAAAVAQIEPAKTMLVFADSSGDYIKETAINADRMPGSFDYYAVVITVMVGLWGAMSAGRLIRSEIVRGTAVRFVAAPVRKSDIFIGKVLGSIVLNLLCVIIVMVFSKYVFKAYWGEHTGVVLAVLFSLVMISVSFGLAVGYVLKGAASTGVINLIVQLCSFFGGAYFPIGEDAGQGMMGFLVQLSPIRWANRALTEIIYGNELSAAWHVIGKNLGFAALFLLASAIFMHRREGL